MRAVGMIYGAVNLPVLERVPADAARVLDIGCGTGALGREIKRRRACEVVGVTHSEEEAEEARRHLDGVLVRDLNGFDPRETGRFDCVVCSHVLEHLYRPERLLASLRGTISSGGTLVVALPNTVHWRQRVEFARGKFRYTEGGLMDSTHYRFYDWATAHELLRGSGYVVSESEACGGFPASRHVPLVGHLLDRASLRLSPGMFGFQFVFVCRPAQEKAERAATL